MQPRLESADNRARAAWATWVAVAALGAVLFLLSWTRIRDVDFWWQCEIGKFVRENGLPIIERWMHTRLGKPVITASWGYCAGLSWLNDLGGPELLILLKSLLLLVAFLGSGAVAWRRQGGISLVIALWIGIMVISQRAVIRPEVVTYALLGTMMFALDSAGPRGAGSPSRVRAWLAIPCLGLWANVHSTFIIGLVLLGAWWVGQVVEAFAVRFSTGAGRVWSRETLASFLIVIAGVAVTFVNPNGLANWEIPTRRAVALLGAGANASRLGLIVIGLGVVFAMLAMMIAHSRLGAWWRLRSPAERAARERMLGRAWVVGVIAGLCVLGWVGTRQASVVEETPQGVPQASLLERAYSTELATPWSLRGQYVAVDWFFVLAPLAGGALAFRPRRVGMVAGVAAVIGLVMGVLAARALGVAAIACLPAAAVGVDAILNGVVRLAPAGERWRGIAVRAASAVIVVACGYRAFELVTNRFWIKQGDSTLFGMGIHPDADLSSIVRVIRAAGPHVRLFNSEKTGSQLMAAGLPVYMDSRMFDGILTGYVRILRRPETIERVTDRLGINVLVLDIQQIPLIRHARDHTERWRLVHLDHRAAVYMRAGFAPQVLTLDVRGAGGAQVSEAFARQHNGVRRAGGNGIFDRAVLIRSRVQLGRVLSELGGGQAARELLEDAARIDPGRFPDWTLLGSLRAAVGDQVGAAVAYRSGAERLNDPDAMILLALAHAQRGECTAALSWLERSQAVRELPRQAATLATSLAERCGDQAAKARWAAPSISPRDHR